jgi:large subunit ribosomal protein L23
MKQFSQKAWDIIRRPIITEKSYRVLEDSASRKKYIVEVLPDANKQNIALAVKNVFGVDVFSVNIINAKGKTKRYKGTLGKRSDRKKAIITLNPGQSISAFSGE